MSRIRQQLAEVYRRAVDDIDARGLVRAHGALLRAHAAGAAPLLLGAGKAAGPMAQGVVEELGAVDPHSLVCSPSSESAAPPGLTRVATDHPLPGQRSVDAARQVQRALQHVPPQLPVVVALSGGASAGWLEPIPPLTLDDVVRTQRLLIQAGADIATLNTVRRRLGTLLGGKLALAAAPRPLLCLALVDVVEGGPHDVGSGPTVGDPTGRHDAVRALERLGLWEHTPPGVQQLLTHAASGALDDNPAPGDPRLARSRWMAVGTPALLRDRAAQRAREAGLSVDVGPQLVHGPLDAVVQELATWARGATPGQLRVLAGEPTLRLPAQAGRGGRARHLALATAGALRPLHRAWCVLAAGSDGVDGDGTAAGAVISDGPLRAIDPGRIDDALARADSGGLLASLGAELAAGPSGTNLCDLVMLWVGDEVAS